jgi:hypothetical protein
VRWNESYGGQSTTDDIGVYISPHLGYKAYHAEYTVNISKHTHNYLPPVSRLTFKMALPKKKNNFIGLRTEFATGKRELYESFNNYVPYPYSVYSVWAMYGWFLQ